MPSKNKLSVWFVLKYTLLATVIGFLAGVVGMLWAVTGGWPIGDILTTVDLSQIARNTSRVTVTVDEQLQEVVRAVTPSIVFIERKNLATKNTNESYTMLGFGSALTNDGWIVTSTHVVTDEEVKQLSVRTSDGKRYAVVTSKRDWLEPILFVKIQAAHLPPVAFADDESITVGQSALMIYPGADPKTSSIALSRVKQIAWFPQGPEFRASSEVSPERLQLLETPAKEYLGMPVVNLSGEVIGLVDRAGELMEVVPAWIVAQLSRSFVSALDIRRTWLGVQYIDLVHAADAFPISRTGGLRKGALLSAADKNSAVEKDSPASRAGFKAGDIIMKVEDEEVNGRNSLTKLIQSYPPGTEVTITFLREGKEQVASVRLGALK